MIIDTHAHMDYEAFAPDFDDVLMRAREAGVTRIVTIATGVESSLRAVALAEKYREIFAVVGIHPCHAHEEEPDAIERLEALLGHPKVVAVGETGMDFFHLPSKQKRQGSNAQPPAGPEEDAAVVAAQERVFHALLDLAALYKKNVVVHQRAAWEETLRGLAPFTGKLRGVFHCFGGTVAQAKEVLSLGHLVSFTGIVTFKNGWNMREVAAAVPPGSFMVETDCPYLAPEPHRGKRCEPAHTRLIAERVAAVRRMENEALFAETTAAAVSFFQLPSKDA